MLAEDVALFIKRFVAMSDDQLVVVALWAIHTHAFAWFPQTPYLAVTSPEKQCGKSRLLEVLHLIVREPWYAVLPSEAVVYRYISAKMPTLLLDETDTIFSVKNGDRYEGLRAMLNAGHRKGAKVPRCVGPTSEIAEFSVYCPKVLAGIGTLPDTVADRSVPIRLERRTDEPIEKFKMRDVEPAAAALRDQIVAWCQEHVQAIHDARPDMPEELSDREQEGCEPLVAIADELGCGDRARAALVALLGAGRLDSPASLGLALLADLHIWFAQRPGTEWAYTSWLLDGLKEMEESPWSGYNNGRGITDRNIASLLKPYSVHSKQIWNESRTAQARGYRREDLVPAWGRYLPVTTT